MANRNNKKKRRSATEEGLSSISKAFGGRGNVKEKKMTPEEAAKRQEKILKSLRKRFGR